MSKSCSAARTGQSLVHVPDALDEEKLAAALADGVLTIEIPKLPHAQPRKIQISASVGDAKQLKE